MTCDQCGGTCYKVRQIGEKWLGADCDSRCAGKELLRLSVNNPFSEIVLDHVFDEKGNKVRTTSLRQLERAQYRHDFAHVILNQDASNVSAPPQQRVRTVRDVYKQKFHRSSL